MRPSKMLFVMLLMIASCGPKVSYPTLIYRPAPTIPKEAKCSAPDIESITELPEDEFKCVVGWQTGLKEMPKLCQAALDDCTADAIKVAEASAASEREHWKAHSVRRWMLWLVVPSAVVFGGVIGYGLGSL